jgi:hypothetical protein
MREIVLAHGTVNERQWRALGFMPRAERLPAPIPWRVGFGKDGVPFDERPDELDARARAQHDAALARQAAVLAGDPPWEVADKRCRFRPARGWLSLDHLENTGRTCRWLDLYIKRTNTWPPRTDAAGNILEQAREEPAPTRDYICGSKTAPFVRVEPGFGLRVVRVTWASSAPCVLLFDEPLVNTVWTPLLRFDEPQWNAIVTVFVWEA